MEYLKSIKKIKIEYLSSGKIKILRVFYLFFFYKYGMTFFQNLKFQQQDKYFLFCNYFVSNKN